MWWCKRGLAAIVLVLGAALLVGCQVRPLYAPAGGRLGPQSILPAIAVDAPVTREEQVFRNALLFAMQGGGGGVSPRYDMAFRFTIREQEILVERDSGTPNAYQLSGDVSFLVKERASGRSLYGTNVTAVDSYTRTSQNFSNVRARRDAEDRLAKSLAELTQARVAAYFATN